MLFIGAQAHPRGSESISRYLNNLFFKKRELVKLEIDVLDRVRAEWESILVDNVTDRVRAETAIAACYQYLGLERPMMIWANHPLNVLKILIDRLDCENISGQIIAQIWNSSELEIQRTISPVARMQVLQYFQDKSIDAPLSIDQGKVMADRLNELIFDRITNIYNFITQDSLPSPLQDYRIADLSDLDYFHRIGVNIPQIKLLVDLAQSCGWCWAFKKLVILTPKINHIQIDGSGKIVGIIYDELNLLEL